MTKEQKGKVLVVHFSGTIEENEDFEALIGDVQKEIHEEIQVYTKGVSRINSMGVRNWIKYFQTLAAEKIKIRFFECSTTIVQQINLISNFTAGGIVESIYAPFVCEGCGGELLGLFQAKELIKMNLEVPDQKCGKCGGNAVFDDLPREYFGFLSRA